MLFFFRKLAEVMLLPIGLAGILVLLGTLLRRRWLVFTGVLGLYALSTSVVAKLLIYPLEKVYPSETIDAAPQADAIVVLSGAIVRGVSSGEVEWGDSSNRYFAGFDLAQANKAKLLILSTGAQPAAGHINQGEVLEKTALAHGLAADRIILTRYVLTTEDEARAISAIPDIHSVLLVTSAFHMPRSAMLFRSRGMTVFPFPADQRVLGHPVFGPLAWLPEASQLHDSEIALREYYGLAVYRTLLLFRSPTR
jgi:uncharacterized SAM-binding protein YcdF (DUF218 family)